AQQMDVNEQAINALFGELQQRTDYAGEAKVFEQLVAAYAKITIKDVNTQLDDLWAPAPDGKLYTLDDVYGRCMDFAFGKVMTGATDADTAIRQATRDLANRGIRTLANGKKGGTVSIEYATRRYVLNRMGALHAEIQNQNHDKMGADGWELSAHGGSAPDHEPYQGRQYSDKDYARLNNSLERKIGTWQCKHIAFPIVLGKSDALYTDAQLQDLTDRNAAGVIYDGHHFTLYQAEQERAAIESALRRDKLRCLADDALGDKDQLQTDQIKLNRLSEEYVRFCKGTGQKTRSERVAVAGFGRSEAARARATVKKSRKEFVLHQLNFLGDVPKQQREAIETELALLPKHIRTIVEMHINGIRFTQDESGSFYNPKTKEIAISQHRQDGAVIHEYAHGLERALHLYSDPVFLAIRDKGLEKLTANDIIIDTDTFTDTVLLVQSDKFVSAYQGRIYGEYLQHGANGKVSLDGMREYFSEGMRAFYFESDLLKQRDPALYTFIKELIK
ncbi:MAG: phage minor capsid protein, partial [Ruthenibacterium sp.]